MKSYLKGNGQTQKTKRTKGEGADGNLYTNRSIPSNKVNISFHTFNCAYSSNKRGNNWNRKLLNKHFNASQQLNYFTLIRSPNRLFILRSCSTT